MPLFEAVIHNSLWDEKNELENSNNEVGRGLFNP